MVRSGPSGAGPVVPYTLAAQTSSEDEHLHDHSAAHRIIEEIVTIGTRHRSRAAVDTPVPVDFFDAEVIESVNSSDLLDVIAQVVPSFFLRRFPIADGASFIRPTALRGLDSHHTLVLINGKRLHRSALVGLFGFGPHGADISSLPSGSIASMEVLRDGAAALYGSDAIAGVINFNLKNSDSGANFSARYGGYTEGDGQELRLEGGSGSVARGPSMSARSTPRPSRQVAQRPTTLLLETRKLRLSRQPRASSPLATSPTLDQMPTPIPMLPMVICCK